MVFPHIRNRCTSFPCMEVTAFFFLSFSFPPCFLPLPSSLSLSGAFKLFMWLLTSWPQYGLHHVSFACYSCSIFYLQISLSSDLVQFFIIYFFQFFFSLPHSFSFPLLVSDLQVCWIVWCHAAGLWGSVYFLKWFFCLLFILDDDSTFRFT